jgi:hypothetical protein
LNEGKETTKVLPKVNLQIVGFGKDSNGNSTANFLTFDGKSRINIQTNGDMPTTHSLAIRKKVSDLTSDELQEIRDEVVRYIKNYGTAKQKAAMVVG